ncbi:hypothetical protein C8F01DRAFT_488225 [Mycena amicta]|nr:hypothetical protein C8F01DRAFT_488225 [Mycena amicta]
MKHSRSPSPELPRKRQHLNLLPPSSDNLNEHDDDDEWSSHRTRHRKLDALFPLPPPSLPRYGLHPRDSPSNPFGRSRAWKLMQDLPPSTPVAKHVSLRFQYVRRGMRKDQKAPTEGIYRLVQVPPNYTLVHVRCLIWWLFGGMVGVSPPEPGVSTAHLNPHPDIVAQTKEDEEAPYKFEMKHDVLMYSSMFRPGQIKTGTTWAVASGLLDPYLYTPDPETDDDDDEEDEEDRREKDMAAEEDAVAAIEDDARRWMAEEDVTIGHVWPEGNDTSRGIIYTHNPLLQVHITSTTEPVSVERRRRKCRDPFVFKAVGNAYLDPPFATLTGKLPAEKHAFEFKDEELWNGEDAFGEYYIKNTILPMTAYKLEEERADAATNKQEMPEATFSSSPTRSSSSMVPTPKSRRHSSPGPRIARGSDPFSSSPSRAGSSIPLYTPAPKPAQRKRIMHLQRQIGALTRAAERLRDESREKRETKKVEKRQRALQQALEAQIEWSLEMAASGGPSPEA